MKKKSAKRPATVLEPIQLAKVIGGFTITDGRVIGVKA
jgi:hypothetical protein